ncbi:MAG: hypothetical protein ACHQ9S_22130 [Candidatus Binatia bacterium]
MLELVVWLVGIMVSVGAWFLAAMFAKDESRANGLLAVLVTLTLTGVFALEVERVTERHERETFMDKVVPTVKNPAWQDLMKDIAATDAVPIPNEFEASLIERPRQRISALLRDARNGLFTVDSIADAVLLSDDLIDRAKQTIRATSYIVPAAWWTTEAGKRYEDKIKQAVRRGVTCERIYLVFDDKELQDLGAIASAQRAYGVMVKYARISELPQDQRVDFIVIDGLAVGKLELDNRQFKSAAFYAAKTIGEDFEQKFKLMGLASYEFVAGRSSESAE